MEHGQLTVSDEMAELMGQKFPLDEVDENGKTIDKTGGDELTEEQKQAAKDAADAEAAKGVDKTFTIKTNPNATDDDDTTGDETQTPIEYLLAEYGLEGDEDFKDFDVKDGSVANIQKFYAKREEVIKKQVEAELFQSDEDLKSLAEWKKAGKSVASWKATQEAENFNFEIKKEDIEGQEKIVRNHYKDLGLSEKRINALIEQAKDDDELFAEAEKVVAEVKATLKANAAAKAKQEEDAAKVAAKEKEDSINLLTGIIKGGKLDNRLVIPEKERADFNKYIFSAAREEKWSKLTPEQELLMEYILFKDFEVKGVEKKAPVVGNVGTGQRKAPLANRGADNDTVEEMSFEELRSKARKS